MGDRGNIMVVNKGAQNHVYLYTHWDGYRLPNVLAKALASDAGQGRADDTPYLTRILFDAMTEGSHGEATGYGISTTLCDNEHPILVVDPDIQMVGVAREGFEHGGIEACENSWSFDTFSSMIAALDAETEAWDVLK